MELAAAILRRLRAPKRLVEGVSACVGGHMRFLDTRRMKRSTLRRLIGRPHFHVELELHRLDCLSSHGLSDNYCYLLDRIAEFAEEPVVPAPLVSGHDVLALGVRPGPRVGHVLSEAQDLQLEGIIVTRPDALDWLARRVGTNGVGDDEES